MADQDKPTITKHEFKYDKARVQTLLEDVMFLAEYALAKGNLSDSVDITTLLELQQYKEEVESLPTKSLPKLAKYYEILSLELAPVTADTLRATSRLTLRYKDTIVGRHLVKLWYITCAMIVLILLFDIVEILFPTAELKAGNGFSFLPFMHKIQIKLIPFAYGALGACAYLLRVTEQHLRSRQFDPIRIPEHWNRDRKSVV